MAQYKPKAKQSKMDAFKSVLISHKEEKMGNRKTAEEIAAEIAALKELLPQLKRSNRAIQTEIDVLEGELSHDDVHDKFEGTPNFDVANDARMWRDGDSSADAMSVQWKKLL